jgi:hypothetical protein
LNSLKDFKVHFGLDCGMMEFFTYKPQSKEQLISLPAFLEHGSAKKIAVRAHANRDTNMQED